MRNERGREREHQCRGVLGGGRREERRLCEGDTTDHLPMLDHLSALYSVQRAVQRAVPYSTPATQTVSLSPTTHTRRRANTDIKTFATPTTVTLLMNKIKSYISPGIDRLTHHDSVSSNLFIYLFFFINFVVVCINYKSVRKVFLITERP